MEKEYTLKEKAYEIVFSKIDEGFMSSGNVCHAETFNKAKSQLLKQVEWDGWRLISSCEELTYLNIPIRRNKDYDIVIYEGQEVRRHQVEEIKAEKARNSALDAILSDPNIKYCYIRKGSYYRPNSCGYTSYKSDAGVYTKEKAVSEARGVKPITLEPINIEEHNKMISERIDDLKSRLITI